MVRRIGLLALSLSLLCVPSAHAASIFLPDAAANAFFALAFDPTGDPPPDTVVVDLTGSAAGNIFDTVAAADMGPAVATVVEPGNSVDLTTATPGALNIVFDFAGAIFGDGGVLQLNGIGSPVALDAALAGFVGPVSGIFSFLQAQEVDGGTVNIYQLVQITGPGPQPTEVPEPASMTLVGLGIAAAAARRRSMRKGNA